MEIFSLAWLRSFTVFLHYIFIRSGFKKFLNQAYTESRISFLLFSEVYGALKGPCGIAPRSNYLSNQHPSRWMAKAANFEVEPLRLKKKGKDCHNDRGIILKWKNSVHGKKSSQFSLTLITVFLQRACPSAAHREQVWPESFKEIFM